MKGIDMDKVSKKYIKTDIHSNFIMKNSIFEELFFDDRKRGNLIKLLQMFNIEIFEKKKYPYFGLRLKSMKKKYEKNK